MSENKKFILASASKRRRFFFSNLKINFSIICPNIDETIKKNEDPEKYTKRIAKEKFHNVLNGNKNRIIVSADTIVVLKNNILKKPKDKQQASYFIETLSDNWHCVLTAIVVGNNENSFCGIDKTLVHFKNLTKKDIEIYIESNEWVGKAGGYAVQGFGSFLIDEIKGSVDNVIGFPVNVFYKLLRKL